MCHFKASLNTLVFPACSSVLNDVTTGLHVKPVRYEAIKCCCEDGRSPKTAALQLEIPFVSLMIHWQLATLSSTFHTWLPSRGLQKKSHFKESISFIAVALWKRPLLKYCMTLGPLVKPPNQTQLAGTKTLLEVSHWLRYDFYLSTAKCVHTWDVFSHGILWVCELWWRCPLRTGWGQ